LHTVPEWCRNHAEGPILARHHREKEEGPRTAGLVREHDHHFLGAVAIEIAHDAKVVRKLDDRPSRSTHNRRRADPATVGERHRPQSLVKPDVCRVLQLFGGWR